MVVFKANGPVWTFLLLFLQHFYLEGKLFFKAELIFFLRMIKPFQCPKFHHSTTTRKTLKVPIIRSVLFVPIIKEFTYLFECCQRCVSYLREVEPIFLPSPLALKIIKLCRIRARSYLFEFKTSSTVINFRIHVCESSFGFELSNWAYSIRLNLKK